jgi:hypothetical protein
MLLELRGPGWMVFRSEAQCAAPPGRRMLRSEVSHALPPPGDSLRGGLPPRLTSTFPPARRTTRQMLHRLSRRAPDHRADHPH